MEEPAGAGGAGQQRQDRERARRLARHRHGVRVPAERDDVLPHPAQRRELVEQPEIAFAHLRQAQESQGAQPVVDGDDDEVAALGEHGAVVPAEAARAAGVAAAVQEHQDRTRPRDGARPPHVHRQAVLRLLRLLRPHHALQPGSGLRRGRARRGRLAYIRPRLGGTRAAESGGRRVRDAQERRDRAAGRAAHPPCRRLDDHRVRQARGRPCGGMIGEARPPGQQATQLIWPRSLVAAPPS